MNTPNRCARDLFYRAALAASAALSLCGLAQGATLTVKDGESIQAAVARAAPGDRIEVETGQGRFRYVVDGRRSKGDPVEPLKAGASRLTLAGPRQRGASSEREVVFVDALPRTANGKILRRELAARRWTP